MLLVLRAFADSWGIAGLTRPGARDYSMSLIRGQLPAHSLNTNSGLYWYVAWLPEIDPFHWFFFVRNHPEKRKSRGYHQISKLEQVDRS